ncbi:MAG: aspartate aminotransferase family protein [Lachnospiraceae bacterium]|nr:aspartate aminotransferase family protein [Lachnospiraceae bacterium]
MDNFTRHFFPVLTQLPIVLSRGEGSWVYDTSGNKYLDLNSGQFCAILGHSNKDIAKIVADSSLKIQNTGTLALSEDAVKAADYLHDICPEMNARVVILSTGAEANEACLRYLKFLNNKPGVICFDRAYHGLTHGTESYSMAGRHVRPAVPDTYVVPVPKNNSEDEIDKCLEVLETTVQTYKDRIACAFFEPIVSSGGLIIPYERYFVETQRILKSNGIFLAFDEAQTGMGRTGFWFCCQRYGVVPDAITLSKGLGAGYPVSAVLFNGNSFNEDSYVMHMYSSHQNDPFASAIICGVIDTIKKGGLLESNVKKGELLLSKLKELEKKYPDRIRNARGCGLMCGFDISDESISDKEAAIKGSSFVLNALKQNLLLQDCNSGRTIRLLPNYYLTEEEFDYLINGIEKMFKEGE